MVLMLGFLSCCAAPAASAASSFAAVDGLAQERELLLHGLDLLFASHIWFLPVMNWLFKAKPARR